MKLKEATLNLLQQMAVALASHDINIYARPRFFAQETENETHELLTLISKYETKLLNYITKFDKIVSESIMQTALQTVLDKIDDTYQHDTWQNWQTRDIIRTILDEFVRLFYEAEEMKEEIPVLV